MSKYETCENFFVVFNCCDYSDMEVMFLVLVAVGSRILISREMLVLVVEQ